jgi:hypothetical protein
MVNSDPVQDLETLAMDATRAEETGDVDFLETALADDFKGIGPLGFVLGKEGWLARHRSGDLKYQSIKIDEVEFRSYGASTGILNALQTNKATYQGRDASGRFRVTLVFVKQTGSWKIANYQLSATMPGMPSQVAAAQRGPQE